MDVETAVRAAARNRLPVGLSWDEVWRTLRIAARRYRCQTAEARTKLRNGA